MNYLIEALLIFQKYMADEMYPTWCEHDVLHVCCDASKVSEDDIVRLDTLGFIKDDEDSFISFKYGSC